MLQQLIPAYMREHNVLELKIEYRKGLKTIYPVQLL